MLSFHSMVLLGSWMDSRVCCWKSCFSKVSGWYFGWFDVQCALQTHISNNVIVC